MSRDKLIACGIGIKTTTYFKLMYVIYADDDQLYGVTHIAFFGMD